MRERATSDINVISQFLIVLIFISFLFVLFGKDTENGTKKALGKAWNSDAEGESLKLLKESGAIIAEFDVVEIPHDSAARLRCSLRDARKCKRA